MRTILASTEGLKLRFANGCKETLNQVSQTTSFRRSNTNCFKMTLKHYDKLHLHLKHHSLQSLASEKVKLHPSADNFQNKAINCS